MSTVEQSGNPSDGSEITEYEEPALGDVLSGIDELDLEQGLCSLRVQTIIFETNRRRDKAQPTDIQFLEDGDGSPQTTQAKAIGQLNKNWHIFATQEGDPGEVRQTLYFGKASTKGQWETIPVFLMLEKANQNKCSVSLCLPADKNKGLDWGLVCTKDDETKAITSDQALKDIPQTNAVVLDRLIELLTLPQEKQKGSLDLLEVLHLQELHDYAFPKPVIGAEFTTASTETSRTDLAKKLRNIGEWAVLSATTKTKDTHLDQARSQLLRFRPIDPSLTEVSRAVTNLGTTEKSRVLGHLSILSSDEDPIFVPNPDTRAHFSERAKTEIIEHAEAAYDIPEIITNPEMTTKIDGIIAGLLANSQPEEHAELFNLRITELIKQWREENSNLTESRDVVLSLGSIDLSQLGPGSYMSFPTWGHKLSASVNANKQQHIFDYSKSNPYLRETNLYRCSVVGAARAYIWTSGSELFAKECAEAFTLSNVTNSVAHDVGVAFSGEIDNYDNVRSSHTTGCLAESCGVAFDLALAHNSMAVNCGQAFTRLHEDSRNITAELCGGKRKKLFTWHIQKLTVDGYPKRNTSKKITKKEKEELGIVEINSTARSLRSSYKAGKRFGEMAV